MNLNATLLVQILCFIAFVAVTMKYIWPLIIEVLEKRRKEIADGLAAGEQGRKDLELAQHKSKALLTEAKAEASRLIEQANSRANHIIEESKQQAREEGERLIEMAHGQIQQNYHAAKSTLMKEVAQVVIAGAEKILCREVDRASNDRLIKELVQEESI